MARSSWKFFGRARRPSNRFSHESSSSVTNSALRSSSPTEEKESLSLNEALEQLQLPLPYSNESAVDQDESDRLSDVRSDSSLAQQEAVLEDMIVDLIVGGQSDLLMANSGIAVAIGDYHVCVSCTQEQRSEYRTWEWHGHIMLFHEGEGYVPEYVYGSFSEPVQEEEDYDRGSLGVGFGLGGILGEVNGRIVTRQGNA